MIWKNILFTIKGGNNHRLVRQTLTPAFTSSKLKMMLEVCNRNTAVHRGQVNREKTHMNYQLRFNFDSLTCLNNPFLKVF